MNIVNLISDINPISVPGLLKLAEKNKNDNTVEPFETVEDGNFGVLGIIVPCICLLYTSPSPRDKRQSRMPSSA